MPIVQVGAFEGLLASCEVCGADSPYLGDEMCDGYVINDDNSARWDIDGWVLIYDNAGVEVARTYCPKHAARAE